MTSQNSFLQRRASKTGLGVRLLLLVLTAFAPLCPVAAQSVAPEPQREELLNGLRVLFWQRTADPEVLIKLRIHSGAAFDMAGKEGLMALLSDSLFPDPSTREDVTEELGGRLDVTTNYDTIDVTLAGRATEFERLLELLRNALLNTQITPEVLARLREARTKAVREISIAPATLADRAIAARLFGAFPYGRTTTGVPESLARIDRADLLLARERFLNPNNASLVVIGGVERVRVRRVLRQFLGAWRKSDRDVPATFRQPEPTDTRTLVVNLPDMPDAEVRLAVRGFARTEHEGTAARVLAVVARERWLKSLPELKGRPFFVTHQAYLLSGEFRLGASVPASLAAQAIEKGRGVLASLADAPPTAAELEFARKEISATLNARADNAQAVADEWLNTATYNRSPADDLKSLNALTPAELQRLAARLLRTGMVAAVAVGDVAQLRDGLSRLGEIEVFGAQAGATGPRPANTNAPATTQPAATQPPTPQPRTQPTTNQPTTQPPATTQQPTATRPAAPAATPQPPSTAAPSPPNSGATTPRRP